MKKINPSSSKHIINKGKFTKHQSHQINSNNIYGPKNTSISLLTSPSNNSKILKAERLFSPSEQNKDKTVTNKQKMKGIQIFSPSNKNKVKLDLEIKKSLFDKDKDSLRHSKKLKYPKEIENEPCLTSNNESREKSPFKKQVDLDKDMLNTYKNNQKDEILNKDINLCEKIKRNDDYNFYDNNTNKSNMDPLQKQLKLIKNLLRSKNYQNFVKKLLNSENILLNENGKLIKFNLFNEDLYNYEFLDVYYQHHIPFIIMRPRVDRISRRKRVEKLKKNQEEESSNRVSMSDLSKNFKENESGQNSLLTKSQQNIDESSSNTNSKFDKKISVQITQVPGSLVLTKMPQKTEENTRNKILNIAFNRAKDAARVIRRLEYSYGMRTNIIFYQSKFIKKMQELYRIGGKIFFFSRKIKKK